jgi:hypothetical protein
VERFVTHLAAPAVAVLVSAGIASAEISGGSPAGGATAAHGLNWASHDCVGAP